MCPWLASAIAIAGSCPSVAVTPAASSRLPSATRNSTSACFHTRLWDRIVLRFMYFTPDMPSGSRIAVKQYASTFHGVHATAAGAALLFARTHASTFHEPVHGVNTAGLSVMPSIALWV